MNQSDWKWSGSESTRIKRRKKHTRLKWKSCKMKNHAKCEKAGKRSRPPCACVSSCETIFVIFPHLFSVILAIIRAAQLIPLIWLPMQIFQFQWNWSNFTILSILHGRNWPLLPLLLLLLPLLCFRLYRDLCGSCILSHVWIEFDVLFRPHFGHILATCQSPMLTI